MKYSFLTGALISAALITPAFATDITVRDFAGKITIVEGNDGLDIVRQGKRDVDYRDNAEEIVIDGGLTRKDRGKVCEYDSGFRISINGHDAWEAKALKDYPELVISVPRGSDLTIKDSSVRLDSQVALGDADLEISGCFDTNLADADSVSLQKSGSGDITVGTVGILSVSKSGSGDLEIVRAARLELSQSGSGEVEVDRVDGPLDIEKSGSGDIQIDALNGPLDIDKSGSGDIEVDGGTVPDLSIHNSGSGDVDIHASVGDAYIRASGSGDIYVKSISGSLDKTVSGAADFSRGDD